MYRAELILIKDSIAEFDFKVKEYIGKFAGFAG